MLAGFAEDFAQQFAAAVGDQMLLGVAGAGVDQAHDLDDALDAIQIAAAGMLQRAHQIHGHGAGCLLAFFGRHVLAQLADPGLAVLLGDMAAEEHQIAGLHIGQVGGCRHGHFGQGDVQGFEFFIDAHDGSKKCEAKDRQV